MADTKCDDCYKAPRVLCYKRSTFRFIVYIIFFIGYLLFGACSFMWLESPIEEDAGRILSTRRREFLATYTCVTEDAMDSLLNAISDAGGVGVHMVGNVTSPTNWDIGQSIFFAMTVITTIGYGRTTPHTDIGKGFCILYALIGIPFTLILFSAAAERIYKPTYELLIWLEEKLKHQFTKFDIRLMHLAFVGLMVGVFFLVIPSMLLTYFEHDWNFLNSAYYCFISLSTIGLGDFVPGENASENVRTMYKIVVTVYIFMGLIAVVIFLEFFHMIPELNFGYQIYQASDDQDDDQENDGVNSQGDLSASNGSVNYETTSETAKLVSKSVF